MRFTHFEGLAYEWMVKASALYTEKKLYFISAMMGKAFAILFAFHIIHSNVCLLIKIRGKYEIHIGRNGLCGGKMNIITIDIFQLVYQLKKHSNSDCQVLFCA